MSGINATVQTRIKGRPAIVRRLRGLLIAVHRYGRHRARTPGERIWTARLLDRLQAALGDADASDEAQP
jgi:hypothetical protein